jgi:pimeloyl-ACP methyl ester carboxylesterase
VIAAAVRSRLRWLFAIAVVTTITVATAADPAGESGRLLKVRGAQLYVQTYGSGAPIVFLHGGIIFFDNNFSKQKDYFASFRKVVGFDRRGHGHSPDDSRPFSYKEMAEDTAALIEQLGLGPVDVVGHSDGGNVGLILAHDHPNLVRRLVISGANLRAGLPPDELQRRSLWTPQQVNEKVKQIESRLPPTFKTDYQKVAPDGPEHWWTLLEKSYQLWLTPIVITPADLKTIAIPVLVMAGDHDFASIEDTVEIFRALPKGQLLILPATGHGTISDRPELGNLAMREFFESPEQLKGSP